VLAAAVALLAGEGATKWATHRWQRRFVLWPLTGAGRALAEGSPDHRQGDGYARLLELCEAERQAEVEATVGSPRRRLLLGAADRQSRLLEARAEARLAA
jgi:hypothetical protein